MGQQHARLALALFLSLAAAPTVWARRPAEPLAATDPVDRFMLQHNLHPAFEKLGRGLSNLFGGPLEIPLQVHKRYRTDSTGPSFLSGLAHGVFRGGVRSLVGLYETLTFALPYPEGYAPILPTLEYFDRNARRRLPLE